MKRTYQIARAKTSEGRKRLTQFLAREGQLWLLPMLELIETGECVVDELVDVVGRAAVEAILVMSAERVAGPPQQGKQKVEEGVYWYGSQSGRISLKERQLRVVKPRLRKKKPRRGEPVEVSVPAYEAMQKDARLADRMLSIVINGVSTRNYQKVLPEMAEQVGISRSSVSRESIAAGERLLKSLAERDFSQLDLLIIYVDGMQFGDFHVIAAVGVDAEGHKHVLGLREGASENAVVAKALLEDLVARGVKPTRRRLFVIDGSKALRTAIDQVYGRHNPVQRCRKHKERNVLGHLPKEQHDQAKATMRAAWRLDQKQGMAKIEQYASWLQRDWPSAAGSLREGLEEMYTINRLGLPGELRRCLSSTNLIDSTDSGVRQRTRRVTNWQDGSMALRWAAAGFLETEKHYRRIMGYKQLWILGALLDEAVSKKKIAKKRQAG
jgi:putative transposase